MAALNTYEVSTLLWHIAQRPGQSVSLGVFPADRLPTAHRLHMALANAPKCCFVANTDPANQPGKHWVLFVATKARGRICLEYFDSYGLPMPMYADLYATCIRNDFLSMITVVSTVQLQDINSFVCGYYCLLFAHFRATGRSFKFSVNYLRSRSVTAIGRDQFVVTALHSVLHRRRFFTQPNSNPRCLAKSKKCQQSCCSAANLQ
jgi:hypothetical protein